VSDGLLQLSSLELAAGSVWGENPCAEPLPEIGHDDPVRALEAVLLAALEHPPFLVSFSGGRDSSALLAVATKVARREGLPLPIPTTNRFPGRPESNESDWQELVVGDLRLNDWIRHDIDDELDVVGPVAQSVLLRHGVLWPPNLHIHVPLLRDAQGGTLATGFDGDGLFAGWQWARAASILFARTRPAPSDVLHLLNAFAPLRLRTRIALRRNPQRMQWLRPEVEVAVNTAEVRERMAAPLRWPKRIGWWARLRYVAVTSEGFRRMAQDAGAQIVHPFLDADFLAALAKRGGRAGFPTRTEAMNVLFRDVLPPTLISRSHKAHFAGALWNGHSKQFRTNWQGKGVPQDLVDVTGLRREWAEATPDFSTASLLQAAWLAESGSRQLEEQLGRSRD
jgi:hypothetical protein